MGKQRGASGGMIAWVLLAAGGVLFAWSLAPFLSGGPGKLAAHFDGAGRADGWADARGYAAVMGLTGFGMAFFVAGIGYAIRFFPASMLNVPNAAHWRAPENYPRACRIFFGRMLGFAAMNLCWLAALNWQVAEANARTPPSLDGTRMALSTGIYLAAVAAWVLALLLPFFREGKE